GTSDWVERLVQRLEDNRDVGIIGPLLLFEDGSVQHEGMDYQPLPRLGNWIFPIHRKKGWRPGATHGLQRCPAITAACMVARRDLIHDLGGFDDAFAIGDFEDSDLCQRVRARRKASAVDLDVQLYHLERKSQTAGHELWR